MKINLLYDLFVIDEVFQGFARYLRSQDHDVQCINKFLNDDSDLTISCGFLNLNDAYPQTYSGQVVHWYIEIAPLEGINTHLSDLRMQQFKKWGGIYDKLFLRDPRQKVLNRTFKDVLLCCPDPFFHKKLETNFKYDTLFYGNLSSRRQQFLNNTYNFNIYKSDSLKGEEKIIVINESRIVLNIHSDETNAFNPFRTVECLACGSLFITEEFGWVPDGLKPGRDFVSCKLKEIPDKINYYLEHPDEAKRIADSGYRNIWKNFSWEKEWSKINSTLQQKPIKTKEDEFLKNRNYFFITGSQRSGTTLMELILDSHSNVAVFGEPGSYEKIQNKNPEPVDSVLGFKIPMWVYRKEYFEKEFPNSKIIYMIRDIHAIIASMLSIKVWCETELPKEIKNCLSVLPDNFKRRYEKYCSENDLLGQVTLCAYMKQLFWDDYAESSLDVCQVRYEGLIKDPEKTVKKILDFLGLPWDDAVLQHHEIHKGRGLYMGLTESDRPIDDKSIEKWRQILTTDDIKYIYKIVKDLDKETGRNKFYCPVCYFDLSVPFEKCPQYRICSRCSSHFQDPLPEKVYEGPEENFGQGPGKGHLISEEDKKANKYLADTLYSSFKPNSVLDIGCKYPYFLSCFKDKAKNLLGLDALDEIAQYGKELGIQTLKIDVEKSLSDSDNTRWDLITLINVLEHFHNPDKTLPKILRRLADNGKLFIRTPDPEVSGIERDLTTHHLMIHPNLFTYKSLNALIKSHGYEIFRQDKIEGYGQSDFYIRKCKNTSNTVSVCMIVKNEEKNIEDCLRSIQNIADEIVVVDTGSVDKTKEVVSKYTDKIYDFEWVDDFSAARNYSLSKATCDYILWMDADDILECSPMIKKLLEKEDADAYNFNIIYGETEFCHARLFRNNAGIQFKGRVHEVPIIPPELTFKRHTNVNVIHKTSKHSSEDRIKRNLRLLRMDLEENESNTRTMFYLANTLREAGEYDEAVKIYRQYQNLSHWDEEKWMSHKYVARIWIDKKLYKDAINELLKAISVDDRWAESYYYIGECYFLLGNYTKSIQWMKMAANTPEPDTTLFKEARIYKDLPYRYLAAAYETLKDYKKALENARKASEELPGDQWLRDRISYFESLVPPTEIATTQKNKKPYIIECYRQGAIGDCIMTTAALKALKFENPDCKIRYITHPNSMPILAENPYIDELTARGGEANQKIYFCYPDKDSHLMDEGYPYKPLNRHLIDIFNECAGVPGAGLETNIHLSDWHEKFVKNLQDNNGPYVTLHTTAGWSPYKEWFDDRWEEIIKTVINMGYTVLQISGKNDPPQLANTIDVRYDDIKCTVAAIKGAHLHIGIDSCPSHAAHAVGTKAVVLFGSTSPTGSGYPENINIWKACDCSPCYREYGWAKESRDKCPYNKRCMDQISIDEVQTAIKSFL